MSDRLIVQDIRRLYKSGNSFVVSFPPSAISKTVFRYRKTVKVRIYADKIVITPLR